MKSLLSCTGSQKDIGLKQLAKSLIERRSKAKDSHASKWTWKKRGILVWGIW